MKWLIALSSILFLISAGLTNKILADQRKISNLELDISFFQNVVETAAEEIPGYKKQIANLNERLIRQADRANSLMANALVEFKEDPSILAKCKEDRDNFKERLERQVKRAETYQAELFKCEDINL